MYHYRVTLLVEERSALEDLVSTGNAASRKLTHARSLRIDDPPRIPEVDPTADVRRLHNIARVIRGSRSLSA
jgi:hypothetical protein